MSTAQITAQIKIDITDRVIAALQAGTVPWQKNWRTVGGMPVSMSTNKPLRGINVWLTLLTAWDRGYTSPWWGTVKRINELGGHVRKGQNRDNGCGATTLVLWNPAAKTKKADGDDTTEEGYTYLYATTWRVFNAEQCEGLPEKYYPQQATQADVPVLSGPQDILNGYLNHDGPSLQHVPGDRAGYQPERDTITLPDRRQFRSPNHYYATAFHEATHSTGHKDRLNRKGIAEFDHFGSGKYAKEELVAQMGSAMMAALAGFETDGLFANSAAYIENWLGVLRNDSHLVVSAAGQAQKACDLILAPTRTLEETIAA